MQNLKGIKNIIFDLGNVLIPLQVQKAGEVFQNLMNNGLSPEAFIEKNRDAFQAYETGKISTARFIETLRQDMVPDVTDEQITDAWNLVLGDFPPRHVELVSKLRPHFRLYILSNTNELHARRFETEVPGVSHISELFDGLHYSHIEGMRKPQPELYEKVIRENGLVPSETLFADDLKENLDAAEKFGIKTLHVTEEVNLYTWFTE
ncbi:MAG: HAD family hydrolase [Bacteroidota bacterium]